MLSFSLVLQGIKALISLHLIFSCLASFFFCCLRVDESSMSSPVDVVTEHFPGLPLQLPTAAVVDDDIFVDYNIVAHCLSRCCCCYSCCCYAVAEPHQPSALSILNRTRPRISIPRPHHSTWQLCIFQAFCIQILAWPKVLDALDRGRGCYIGF